MNKIIDIIVYLLSFSSAERVSMKEAVRRKEKRGARDSRVGTGKLEEGRPHFLLHTDYWPNSGWC